MEVNPYLGEMGEENLNAYNDDSLNEDVYPMVNQVAEELDGITKSVNSQLRRGINQLDERLNQLENSLPSSKGYPIPNPLGNLVSTNPLYTLQTNYGPGIPNPNPNLTATAQTTSTGTLGPFNPNAMQPIGPVNPLGPFNPNVMQPIDPIEGPKPCPPPVVACPPPVINVAAPVVNLECKPVVGINLNAADVTLNCKLPPITIPPCPPPNVIVQVHPILECPKDDKEDKTCEEKCEEIEDEKEKEECKKKCPEGLKFQNHLQWMTTEKGIKELELYTKLFGYPFEEIDGASMFDVLKNIQRERIKRCRNKVEFGMFIPK